MLQDKLNKTESKLVIEELRGVFGSVISEKISDIYFYYEGFKNKTYRAKYRGEMVQIRIPKFDEDSKMTEKVIAKNFDDYLFYKDGYLIKKWYNGQDLTKIKINRTIIRNLIVEVKKLHNTKFKAPIFNWYSCKIDDTKYDMLLKKYANDDLVLCHNNIKRSNVIVNSLGKIKLIDFGACSYNYPAADAAMMYINLGISKQLLCDEFDITLTQLEDFIYLVKTREKATFSQFYSHLETPLPKIARALYPYQNKFYNYQSRFIVQKVKDGFGDRLNIDLLNEFYFVPVYVYQDDKIIIWRWMEANTTGFLTDRKIRSIARAIKILHTSKIEFPPSVLDKKIKNSLNQIGIEALKEDFDSIFIHNMRKWVSQLNLNANCHNSLSIDNIFFSKNQSVYITQWDQAAKGDPLVDIANLFENMGLNEHQEAIFWKTYGRKCPQDFIKYRVIAQFLAYLANKVKLDDEFHSRINIKRIKDLIYDWNKH
ncbi:phosphotransferase [Mycoplasma sp. 1573]